MKMQREQRRSVEETKCGKEYINSYSERQSWKYWEKYSEIFPSILSLPLSSSLSFLFCFSLFLTTSPSFPSPFSASPSPQPPLPLPHYLSPSLSLATSFLSLFTSRCSLSLSPRPPRGNNETGREQCLRLSRRHTRLPSTQMYVRKGSVACNCLFWPRCFCFLVFCECLRDVVGLPPTSLNTHYGW